MRLENIVAGAVLNCPPGTAYLAAVSGGADSTAMLAALAAVREQIVREQVVREQGAVFNLRCIHVEHGIRPEPESRGDAEFVKCLCKELNVPCKVVSIKPGRIAAAAKERGIGIEAAARLFRRRAWFREAKRLEALPGTLRVRILVAHTADDALETTLMRIFRGSGPTGLAAMPASRGRILRPLIKLPRSAITAWLAEKQIPWREDSSNSDTRFLRNRVRRLLIPRLNESFPDWRTALAAFAETQSLAADFIQKEAKTRILWQPFGIPQNSALYADSGVFFAQPAIVREEALFQGIDALPARPPGVHSRTIKRANIRRFCEGAKKALDLGSLRLRKDSKKVTISIPVQGEYGFSLLINKPGLYTLKETAIEVCEIPVNGNEGEGVFFALLPLVMRPGFKGETVKCPEEYHGNCIAAVDTLGTAACMCQDKILWRRNNAAKMSTNSGFCRVKITKAGIGGTNVR
ncbi:MAG: tRNA lysidine(34) synthetase TilS [Treponema sp.]|jgi:tRNA(Ile)-lysidine synthase|nr:tRNA lysidine(34) synthetase TilS [Treponema sp.]